MKKFSGVVLSLLFVIIFSFGCTYADNATLTTINSKYDDIVNNENYKNSIFKGKYLTLSYEGKILSAINNTSETIDDNSKKFTLLKTATNVEDYENCSHYGLLCYAVNFVYLNNYQTLNSVANNNKVPQDIKKAMYNNLDELEKRVKDLKKQKLFLESVFDDDSRDYQVISKTQLTQDTLSEYLTSLNETLSTVLEFNNLSFKALENIQPRTLENINSLSEFTNSDVNSLIVNAVLLISNYVLEFDIALKNDLVNKNYDVTLINFLKVLLNLTKKTYTGKSTDSKLADFKLICIDENGLLNQEKLFKKAIADLNEKDFLNEELSTSKLSKIAVVENYKNNLSSYLSKIIKFLNNV